MLRGLGMNAPQIARVMPASASQQSMQGNGLYSGPKKLRSATGEAHGRRVQGATQKPTPDT